MTALWQDLKEDEEDEAAGGPRKTYAQMQEELDDAGKRRGEIIAHLIVPHNC